MNMIDANTLVVPISVLGTVAVTVWILRNWFSNQFGKIFDKVESVKEQILRKLEYHEEHDDQRFQEIHDRLTQTNDSIWLLRLKQAQAEVQEKESNVSQTNPQ